MAVIVPMSLPIYACFDSSTTFRLLLPFTSSPSSSSSSSSSSSCRRCVVGPHLAMRRRRPRLFPAPVRAAAGDPPVPAQENKDGVRMASDIQTLLRRFWKVAAPYWSSEDKVQARLRLGAVFALTLATTGISVGFNFLGRDFYNALANKDQEQFTRQLLYYLGGFSVGIPFFVLRDYAREVLSLRWRSWMTSYYMKRYFKNRTFYQIQSQSIIDNPDQRIVDDLSAFTGTALAFSLTLFNAAVDLISFSNILFGIYPPLFVVLFVYSIGGTAVSVYLGKDLVTLNFMQEKKEADFRYGLVRVRENAESIAFYGGEGNEIQLLLQRFASAFENLSQLLVSSRNLEFFTNGYRYLIQILPAAVVAPMYFSGKIEFGVINQSVSAFNHILSDFSLIVFQFQSISAFSAVIDRLGEFDDVLDNSIPTPVSSHEQDISILFTNSSSCESNGSVFVNNKLLEIENLTLQTPKSKRVLIEELSFVLDRRDHLLITGPSGSGKTSLLRAMAGLWRFGKGRIAFYINEGKDISDEDLKGCNGRRASDIFFLPQKPYMVLGTLRQQLLYPMWIDEITTNPQSSGTLPFFSQAQLLGKLTKPATANLEQVLKDVRLGDIVSRFNGFDSVYEWSSVLSLGEQQRLAFARLLLAKPKLVLLDESTSALDEANEAHLYKLIADAGITYISIGHRQTLFNYHNKTLRIFMVDSEGRKRNWQVEPIYQPDAREINTLK